MVCHLLTRFDPKLQLEQELADGYHATNIPVQSGLLLRG